MTDDEIAQARFQVASDVHEAMTGRPLAPLPVTVLTDMLCAAADDLSFPLTRRTADRLADRTIELLELAGWCVIRTDP